MAVPKKRLVVKVADDKVIKNALAEDAQKKSMSDGQKKALFNKVTAKVKEHDAFDFDGDGVSDAAELDRRVGELPESEINFGAMLSPADNPNDYADYINHHTDKALWVSYIPNNIYDGPTQEDKLSTKRAFSDLAIRTYTGCIAREDNCPDTVSPMIYGAYVDATANKESREWTYGEKAVFNYLMYNDIKTIQDNGLDMSTRYRIAAMYTDTIWARTHEALGHDYWQYYTDNILNYNDKEYALRKQRQDISKNYAKGFLSKVPMDVESERLAFERTGKLSPIAENMVGKYSPKQDKDFQSFVEQQWNENANDLLIGNKYMPIKPTQGRYTHDLNLQTDILAQNYGIKNPVDKKDILYNLDRANVLAYSGALDRNGEHKAPGLMYSIEYAMSCDAYSGQDNWSIGQRVIYNAMVTNELRRDKTQLKSMTPYNKVMFSQTLDDMSYLGVYDNFASEVNRLDDRAEQIREANAKAYYDINRDTMFALAQKEPDIKHYIEAGPKADEFKIYLLEASNQHMPLSMDEARAERSKDIYNGVRSVTPGEAQAMKDKMPNRLPLSMDDAREAKNREVRQNDGHLPDAVAFQELQGAENEGSNFDFE